MTADNHTPGDQPERDVQPESSPARPAEAEPEEQPRPTGGIMQQIWRRFQEERNRPRRAEVNTGGRYSMDRSKAFLVLATVVVLSGFAFLALFSTSGAEERAQQRRTQPSLGRPESAAQRAARPGSTVPLLSADQSDGDPAGEQLSPDDILATSRRAQSDGSQRQEQASAKPASQYALSNVPTVDDPALDAYRRQNTFTYTSLPPLPPTPAPAQAVAPVAPAPADDSEVLKKSSLVFVRNAAATTGQAGAVPRPAVIEKEGRSPLLPTGSRLVARLQTAVSSAVKTPVIAVVEYNYERDGEIIIPAGTKAVGQLAQANQNGQVGLRFTTLEMPDGSTEAIEGASVGLDYGPLKGSVSGRNRAKRALVRGITGVGIMASYLVGGRGFGGLSGPVDQSVLLRERIASNIGLAGEQELMALAYSQNVVVTLPGNTRFYIVLQETAAAPNRTFAPATRTNLASADEQALPTAAELRELIALKGELNRMYRELAATRTQVPQPPQR
ncbi:MAG: TrbI/VirB10 family protein [Acidobacteriota bacterium]